MSATEWNPEDLRQRPIWIPSEVAKLLSGQDAARALPRHMTYRGINYFINGIDFACGCSAAEDTGWAPCDDGLHPILANATPESPNVAQFAQYRAVFDTLLRAAWKREPREPEQFYSFWVARQQDISLTFERWQKNHDLVEQLIWQGGALYADLAVIPMELRIALYNGGSPARPNIILQIFDERRECPVTLSGDAAEALATVGLHESP